MDAVGLLDAAQSVVKTGEPLTRTSVPATGTNVAGRIVDAELFRLRPGAVAMTFVDVTEKRAAERELQRRIDFDSLTELWNRTTFRSELDEWLSLGRVFYLAVFDLDRFKEVNDSLGHANGDLLLQTIGERFRENSPSHWFVARLGGDEFALLAAPIESKQEFAESITKLVREPVLIGGLEFRPSASIGVVEAPTDSAEASHLLRLADTSLYAAKRERTDYVVCGSVERNEANRRTKLAESIDHAFEQGQFQLYAQPIVDLQSGYVVGAESLSRWALPASGILTPDKYLSLIQLSGQMTRLTDLMIERSMGLTVAGRFASVNVSAIDLYSDRVCSKIAKLTKGVDPRLVWLELVEGEIPAFAEARIDELIEHGFQVAIDEFNAQFSGLTRLAEHDVPVVKLDRELIGAVLRSDRALAVVRGVVTTMQALGTRVVAEGIETNAELEAARELGCELGQGFLLGRPTPRHIAAPLLVRAGDLSSPQWPDHSEILEAEKVLLKEVSLMGTSPKVAA